MTFEQKQKILRKQLLTTKDAAELIGVSLPSIINWADAGRFRSCRTPGGHRRIRRSDFVDFAKEHGYLSSNNFHNEENSNAKIVVVDNNQDYRETLQEFLLVKDGIDVHVCTNIFEAGVLLGKLRASVLVYDQNTITLPDTTFEFLQRHFGQVIDVVVLATEYPVPAAKQVSNYIYLNKSKSIREVAISLINLVTA